MIERFLQKVKGGYPYMDSNQQGRSTIEPEDVVAERITRGEDDRKATT
jgi:hypothetical protein